MSKLIRRRRVQRSKTPIRQALKASSRLQTLVKDGLGAIESAHRHCFDEPIRLSFADSLDIDEAFREGREQENRWDYLLGFGPSRQIIGVEPHSAKNSEITVVIKKLEAARRQLREHLLEGVHVSKWLWVASGKVHFAPMEKATLRLAQSGIKFVDNKIQYKHLESNEF